MRLTEKEQAMLNGEMGPGFPGAMRVLVGSGKLSALSVWYRSAGGISL